MRADRRSVRRRVSQFIGTDLAAVLEPDGLAAVLAALAGDPEAGRDPASRRQLSNAGSVLLEVTERTGDPAGADAACTCLRAAVAAAPDGDPDLPDYLSNLAMALLSRFEELGERDDADAAVGTAAAAVAQAGPEASDLGRYCSGLTAALNARAMAFGDDTDVRRAIESGRRAVAATSRDHPSYPGRLQNLANALLEWCERTGDPADIGAAIETAAAAVAATGPGDPHLAGRLTALAIALGIRWETAGEAADLDQAVTLYRQAVAVLPESSPDRGTMLSNLSGALAERFDVSGQLTDLDEAIGLALDALAGLPDGHPARPGVLHNLAVCLLSRGEASDDRADLDGAVAAAQEAVSLLPDGHASALAVTGSLGNAVLARYEQAGDPADLEVATALLAGVCAEVPASRPDYAGWLGNYGNARLHQFRRTGALADADDAIRLYQEALDRTPPAAAERAARLDNLAMSWRLRAERTGQAGDLDRAVATAAELVGHVPAGHPLQADSLVGLSQVLMLRFERSGQTGDADRAVAAAAHAARLPAPGYDPLARARRQANLANALLARGRHTGSSADSAQAAGIIRAAVAAIPPGFASYPGRLVNLAYILLERADRLDPADDEEGDPLPLLDEAVTASGTAMRLLPSADPEWWMAAAAHGNARLARYQHSDDPADLEASIGAYRGTLRFLPAGHPDRAGQLANLGGALHLRFQAGGRAGDLTAAVELLRIAVRGSDPAQLDTAIRQLGLGQALVSGLGRPGGQDLLAEAVTHLRATARSTAAPPATRIAAARTWGQAAARAGDWDTAVAGYSAAVALLPVLAWHGLPRDDREQHLAGWPGVARDAAACAVAAGRPERAVELLEQGRAVLWGQVLHLRADLTVLASDHPGLAARLEQVRRVLAAPGPGRLAGAPVPDDGDDLPPDGPLGSARRQSERRMRAAREWDALLAEARALPGFGDFLRPAPFSWLRQAADGGPVVIVNTSQIRCDALIITASGVRVLPLDRVSWDALIEHGDTYLRAVQLLGGYGDAAPGPAGITAQLDAISTTLAWLWDAVAEPVLTALGCTSAPSGGPWPRVWWSATGPLSLLPLHAAGHDQGEPGGPPASVLDRAVSSSTPTLAALIRARAAPASPLAGRKLLVVARPSAPAGSGLPALPGAAAEAGWLAGRFPGACTQHDGGSPRSALRLMAGHDIVHFACHGDHDLARPGRSGMLLADGTLSLEQVGGLDLSRAELAFLSACQTAIGGVRVLDESVHLSAAFQLAGYRHVIGTMWAVADSLSAEVVAGIYDELCGGSGGTLAALDPGRAALAVHHAVRRLRDRYPDLPLRWIPYLHLGP